MMDFIMKIGFAAVGLMTVVVAVGLVALIGIGIAWLAEMFLCLLIGNQKVRIRKILGLGKELP